MDRLTLIFCASLITASAAFAALPWRGMNWDAAEGYAEASEAPALVPKVEVAAVPICAGRLIKAVAVAAPDFAR